ncbi:MAG: putative membrane-bound dehydrogenase-like protein [Limisphaerales bacterium]|jgi:putative membrane-bound dehydrogenase-like protein
MNTPRLRLFLALAVLSFAPADRAVAQLVHAGVARADITPTKAIRLNGYGNRSKPSAGVAQKLWAKSIAIGETDPVILITADLIGVPDWITREVAKRISRKTPFDQSRLAICATHTHTGPTIKGLLENLFMADIPKDQMAVIDEYAEQLVDQLTRVSIQALENRQPSSIRWGKGSVDFAINRRLMKNGKWVGFGEVPDGPVDHSLPILHISVNGKTTALLVNYACHCTTLGGKFNQIHGDWAGRAAELIEANHPGANAMIAIGCGADANPKARGEFESIEPHAQSLAAEVERLLTTQLKTISTAPKTQLQRIALPFDPMPKAPEWQALVDSNSSFSYYAKKILARLAEGKAISKSLPYPIQTWTFGDELAMVFLAGEVVVDYSHRLKEIFDADRLWVNAYANDIPSYIASRRLYDEGGYEVDRSMWYYDKMRRLSKDTEELILDEVVRQLPHRFYAPDTLRQMPAPVKKSAALETIKVPAGMKVELVAAEPLTMDPVDVAWGADGRMWVVEMADYPNGTDDQGTAGGRIRHLEDQNNDGIYDHSTLFLDGLNFPSSVAPWRDGVLITAAPDILFARDTNGDGKADKVTKLFSGFVEGNQQHRVNGLQWGLDNWVHSANGDSNGKIKSHLTGKIVDINGMDFRFRPDTGELETLAGRSQYGRSRDDAGNWFGSNNSWPGWHYALEDKFLRRNRHVRYPSAKVYLQSPPSAGPIHPASRTLNRLNDYTKVNRFTSACGFIIYRDELLGSDFRGNSFICEPVHNLVRREIVEPKGATFASHQPAGESGREFFASTDNWCRPTSVRTGPDGALYVVDMYRFLIEHPQWVPADWQRKLNSREGSDKGRVYRISAATKPPRQIKRLHRLVPAELVAALDTPNGWQRDAAHQLLVWKQDKATIPHLVKTIQSGLNPLARLHALCVLDGMTALDSSELKQALQDSDWQVRRTAVRLGARFPQELLDPQLQLPKDPSAQVRQQLAYSLGALPAAHATRAASTLAALARHPDNDDYINAAVLSSTRSPVNDLAISFSRANTRMPDTLFAGWFGTTLATPETESIDSFAAQIFLAKKRPDLDRLKLFFQVLRQRGKSLQSYQATTKDLINAIRPVLDRQLSVAKSDAAPGLRVKAIELLGTANSPFNYAEQLGGFLTPAHPPKIQIAALNALATSGSSLLPTLVFDRWSGLAPSLRREAVAKLLRNTNWTTKLLTAAKSTPSLASAISPPQRLQLKTHRTASIKTLANKIFGATSQGNRAELIASFKPALALPGNQTRGQELFTIACNVCHKIGDLGRAVGPDLTALSDRSKPAMLTAVLDPNYAVEEKFVSYVVATRDGEEYTGILSEESGAAINLLDAAGNPHSISRGNIRSLRSSGLSLMPEGMEAAFSHQQMADLLAYVAGLGSPNYVEPEADGSIRLTAANGTANRPEIRSPESLSGIGADDEVSWTVKSIPAGIYDIMANSAVDRGYQGKPFQLTVGTRSADGTFETTGALNRFRARKFGNVRIEKSQKETTVRLQHSATGLQLAIREIVLIPQ